MVSVTSGEQYQHKDEMTSKAHFHCHVLFNNLNETSNV